MLPPPPTAGSHVRPSTARVTKQTAAAPKESSSSDGNRGLTETKQAGPELRTFVQRRGYNVRHLEPSAANTFKCKHSHTQGREQTQLSASPTRIKMRL